MKIQNKTLDPAKIKYNFVAVLMTLIVCIGCSRQPTEPAIGSARPLQKSVALTAGENINLYNGSANPVVVRFYQLASRVEFEQADFLSIYDGNTTNLSGAIINKQVLPPIYPKEDMNINIDLDPKTMFFAVFAEFANYGAQKFKDTVPIDPSTLDRGVEIFLTASGISISVSPGPSQAVQENARGIIPAKQSIPKKLLGSLKKVIGGE